MNPLLTPSNKFLNVKLNGYNKKFKIRIINVNNEDYICLTDLARYKDEKHTADIIKNWLRNRHTIEYLGQWEMIHNPQNFNVVEFDQFLKHSGENSFVLPPQQWITKTNAIGIVSKSGRGGGTYAHKDIAFHFAMWLSPQFQLYIIKDYQKLKQIEKKRLKENWDLKRNFAKINYKIHTDAIKNNLITADMDKEYQKIIYATEADMLNQIVFGITAKEWAIQNPDLAKNGNIRDYADALQLSILLNLETLNAEYIEQGLDKKERFKLLYEKAQQIYKSLVERQKSLEKLDSLIDNKNLNG